MKPNLRLELTIIAILLLMQSTHARADAPATRPFTLHEGAGQVSPFTAVRWRGDVVEVRHDDIWAELRSIDDIPIDKLMDYLADCKDKSPRTHLTENLVDVMTGYGHKPGETVRLVLRTLDPQTPRLLTIPAAEMTSDNLAAVMRAGRGFYADGSDELANESRAILDARHEQLMDAMNKYTIEYRAADQDVKVMEAELSEKGGTTLGPDGTAKEIELKRWVVEQTELATQLLKLDVELDQLKDKKAHEQIPPPVVREVDANVDVVHARAAAASAKERVAALEADHLEKSDAAALLKINLTAAQKQLEEIQTAATTKALKDYEDELNWRHQNVKQRLDRIEITVKTLKEELADARNLQHALTLREADVDVYRKFILRYDTQIREIEMAASSRESK